MTPERAAQTARFQALMASAQLRPEMSRSEVRALLGEPDAVGGTSRRYRTPCCFKYGEVQLFFGLRASEGLRMVFSEDEEGQEGFALPWPAEQRAIEANSLVTNPKVAGVEPRWAPFPGFSLLLDNPGGYVPFSDGTELVRCSAAERELRFYRALRDATAELEQRLVRGCSYCPLPYDSMHVTAWDGIAVDGLDWVPTQERPDWERLLRELPGSLCSELFRGIEPFQPENDWRLDFKLQELAVWGNSVLVARLKPAGEAAERALANLVRYRENLDEAWRVRREPSRYPYAPHVSLGYFANRHSGAEAKALLTQHAPTVSHILAGEVLSFRSASLYGFTDMITFFRLQM